MKNWMIPILISIPYLANGQYQTAEVPPFMAPEWLANLVVSVESFPVIGMIIIEVMKWVGFLTSVMTALSVFLMAIKVACEKLSQLALIGPYLQKVIEFIEKALPYAKYLAIFNTQKSEFKK